MTRLPFGKNFALLALLAGLLVLGFYQLFLASAKQQFLHQSRLEGELLAGEAKSRLGLVVSALEMFAQDPHLATYVAAGGPLPPYSRNRVEPAVDLLNQNLPVRDWTLVSFAENKNGELLVELKQDQYQVPVEAMLKAWAPSLDGRYRVGQAGSDAFLYAAPILHREQTWGCFVLVMSNEGFYLEGEPFQLGLEESLSHTALFKLGEQSPLYREDLPLQLGEGKGDWQLQLSRSGQQFWSGEKVAQLRLTSFLCYLLLLMAIAVLLGLESRRAALAANQTKSEFLSSISHEIRNPLSGIVGLTNLTLETNLTPVQQEYLRTVSHSAQSLMSLLNDLLDHSKVEAGALDFTPMPLSLRRVVDEALQTFRALPGKQQVELVSWFDGEVPDELVGDPLRLQQLLINLVGNALKFTEKGEVVVKVTSKPLPEERVELQFSISDSGCGIAPDQLENIFNAFQQADPLTPQVYGGTGLGLSISREFVQRMEGKIWVDSELGKGSQFHFTIRLPRAAPGEWREPSFQGQAVRLEVFNSSLRATLGQTLTRWGLTLASPKESPQLVVVEAHTLGLAREHDCPALALLSRDGLQSEMTQCSRLGLNHHLIKPLSEIQLAQQLRQLLETGKPQPAQVTSPSTGLRVLLAEDGAINQKLGRLLLEELGHTVEVASNGRDVLEHLRNQSFDLVLMDMRMPVLDGLETTRQLRRAGHQDLLIVALTGNARQEDRELCLAAGMNAHMVKPLTERSFFRVLSELMPEANLPQSGSPSRVRPEDSWSGQIFDAKACYQNSAQSPENLKLVVSMFLASVDARYQELEEACEAGDGERLFHLAHQLKGSLRSLYAQRSTQACLAVEEGGRDGNFQTSREELETLNRELKLLTSALEEFLKA